MKEIEVKILEVDVPKIVKKLEDLGAKKTLDTEQEIIYFDNNERTFSKNNLLRLRKNGKVIELAHKKKMSKKGVKIAEETEVHVSDFEKTRKILEGIGFREIRKATKHRISYHLPGVSFELDTYPEVPTFLEIETEDEKLLKEYVKKLGFTMKDTKAWSGKDVLRYYGKLEDFNL
ncbi:MAG: class IV adenylate cyclase [Candidatus Woesearchaeota archaeon]